MAFPCKLGLNTVFLLLQEGCNVALWICSLLATNNASRNVEVIHLALFNHETLRVLFQACLQGQEQVEVKLYTGICRKEDKMLTSSKR